MDASRRRKALAAAALLAVLAGVVIRIAWVRNGADGSELAEGRHAFHARQLEFKSQVARGVVGKRIEEALPQFGGSPQVFRGSRYSWKGWPCELVVREGVVEGVFYHDFPFTTQDLPPDYRVTHVAPYFERHPEFLGDAYRGRWDGKGAYVFEKR